MVVIYLAQLGEGFIDEDEGNEDGKDLLGEAGEESHQEAALKCHDDHHDDYQPHANPHSAHNVLNILGLTELNGDDKVDCECNLCIKDMSRIDGMIFCCNHL